MTIYDQHMHTLYSFDSEAQLRDYLAQTQVPVVTTEHLNLIILMMAGVMICRIMPG